MIDDRVHDRQRTATKELWAGLETPPHRAQLRRVAVAHRDDEVRTDEDRDLTEQDSLGLVDIAGRSQNQEERFAVALELGALMCLDGVLDSELV